MTDHWLATTARWDGAFPLAGHLGVNGGALVLYLLFGLMGYTLWRVRRQQRIFDILFCQVSRRLPSVTLNATHFVEERFWVIGITLIDVFVVATSLVQHSHVLFGYDVSHFTLFVFTKLHYLRLGSSLFLVALFLMMFFESSDRKSFNFRPFVFNTILIAFSVFIIVPVLILEVLLKLYNDFAEGLFIVQLLWHLLLLVSMASIGFHVIINEAEGRQERLSAMNLSRLDGRSRYDNLFKSKAFMVAIIVVQTVFEVAITVWYMMEAYYDPLNTDVDRRATWGGVTRAIYVGLPCLIKCVLYVIGFYSIPKEPSSTQTITMRSLPSRDENPYGSVSLDPYGDARYGDPALKAHALYGRVNQYGLSTPRSLGSSSLNAYGSANLDAYSSVNTMNGVNGEDPYEAWYRTNTASAPRRTVFDPDWHRSQAEITSRNGVTSAVDVDDYKVYTVNIQKVPREPS